MPKLVFLATDIVLWGLLGATALYLRHARRTPTLRATWRLVARDPAAATSLVVLVAFLAVAALDSIHFRLMLPPAPGAEAGATAAYATRTLSLFDRLIEKRMDSREKTYSAPLAYESYSKESILVDDKTVRVFPRLEFGGVHLKEPKTEWARDVLARSARGVAGGLVASVLAGIAVAGILARRTGRSLRASARAILGAETEIPIRPMLLAFAGIALFVGWVAAFWPYYHVFGTDRTGNDVLYQALKSVRTAVVIGSLATLATLPCAIVFGILAGYFKGWVDDLIQYLYTVMSSIPSVLLIAAFVLMIQIHIDKNPDLYETGLERADIRLFLLALVLGVTGWASLARLLRAETLKLGELEYVQAAHAFGVSNWRIMRRHILPNVMHIVLIVGILEFSGIVLYEAVLSYVGVGVDPTTQSFGSMINLARSEMSRDPVVWWNLMSAFLFMVAMVLSANLFAGAVREAFDPRARAFRVRRARPAPVAPSAARPTAEGTR